jgi:hypothetical protein
MCARRIEMVKAALADGVLHVHQISPRICLCKERTEDYLAMLVEDGDIHIKRYAPPATGKQQPIAHYALGKGRNAVRPDPLSFQQRAALARARIYKDEDRYDRFKAVNRAHKALARARTKPQSWLSALGA